MDTQPHVTQNRRVWDALAADYEQPGRRRWAEDERCWGMWGIPESRLKVLPEVAGKDVIELGCGTGFVSAALARLGARPVGIDNSSEQLANAQRFQQEFGLTFPLIQADAEAVPLADAVFDVAISEYGASLWCDPYRWIPEAARLLRPGGELLFLLTAPLLMLCVRDEEELPAEDRLLRSQFGMHRIEWPDTGEIEFCISHGEWIRLLRANHFEVVDLLELQPDENARTRYPHVTVEWARRWPSEEFWKARKAPSAP